MSTSIKKEKFGMRLSNLTLGTSTHAENNAVVKVQDTSVKSKTLNRLFPVFLK